VIIDTEVHLLHPDARNADYLSGEDEPVRHAIHNHDDFPSIQDLLILDELLDSMDRNGIDKCLIMGLPWHDRTAHAENNRYIESVVKSHPNKFRGLYIPKLTHPQKAAERIRQLNTNHFIGVKLIPGWQNVRIDDPVLNPVIEATKSEDLFLMIHTDHLTQSLDGDVPYRLLSFLRKTSGVKVLAPHLGGLLCLYALDPRVEPLLENVWFITSVSLTMEMVKYAADVNSDNIIFGTDFPFNHCHDQKSLIKDLQDLSMPDETKAKILGRTANNIFHCDEW
jgi:predicted TIM-barrel fold metal-dependent hydrolase